MNETKAKTTAKKKQQNNIIDKPPVAAIIKLLEQSQHRFLNGSYSDMRDVFGKFLDMALATLEYQPVEMAWYAVRELAKQPESERESLFPDYDLLTLRYVQELAKWQKTVEGIEAGAMENLTYALAILVKQGRANYDDVIGNVYMEMGQANRWRGQFFTPGEVARVMAQVSIVGGSVDIENWPLEGENCRPLTINDPCCGSGVMFLGAAEAIQKCNPALLKRGLVEFYGQDIDETCVKMARLNLIVHGLNLTGRLWFSYLDDIASSNTAAAANYTTVAGNEQKTVRKVG